MRTMIAKPNHEEMVQEFLNRGGKITKCPPQKVKPKNTREVKVVEIVVEHLPKELAEKFFKED